MKCFRWFVLFLSSVSWTYGNNSLIVTTEQGKLRGKLLKSRNGTEYRSFLGIPFAKPPIGQLRFQSPQEPDNWDGIRDATVSASMCVQTDIFSSGASFAKVYGNEDCLYLNVFSPLNIDSSNKVPVLVLFHGGAFVMGFGSAYSPEYLMDYNVIFVSSNHRLGPFGFLSLADTVIPGNFGMKDQVAVLKWVKKNIAAFGGNPELVTILGDSAGAASVHLHLYSPLSKGLFQRGISQSGSALALWARSKPAVIRQKTLAIGILVGCPVNSSVPLLECLQNVPAEELMLAHHKLYVWDFEPTIHFSIVPEMKQIEDAFIYDNFWLEAPVNDVPWIAGITSGEGAIKVSRFISEERDFFTEINANYKRLLPLMLHFLDWLNYSDSAQTAEAIKKFYFGDREIGFETAKDFVNMITDGNFWYPCFEGLLRYLSTNSKYLYYYDHRNVISFSDFLGNSSIDLGVSHSDDLFSLFAFPLCNIEIKNGVDLHVSERMIKHWVNFARTGNPSTDDKLWHPFNENEVNYLHITSTLDEMRKGLLMDRLSFWRTILSKSHDVPQDKKSKDEL